ncbi:MAG: hypothetical protein K0R26_1108 [Bacteroidota bacterium]|jgi:hypothetical protein|nr:hypothetical protein [Bacteroidota bacterium]
MKIAFGIGIILIICISCKKEYTCECKTIDVHQGFINPVNYQVKEKNEKDALSNCAKQYNASGSATGGIKCDVTQN